MNQEANSSQTPDQSGTLTTIDRRYAKAIFLVADKSKGTLQTWESSFKNALSIFDGSTIGQYLCSPVNPLAKKIQVLEEVFERSGQEMNENFRNFLKLLVENSRFSHLRAISEAFSEEQGRRLGHLKVMVSSASALSENDKETIKRLSVEKLNLTSEFTQFKSASVVENVDPTLLAGSVIEFENRRIDLSLKGKMKKLVSAVKG